MALTAQRLATVVAEQVNVEVVAAFMGLVVGAQVLEAAFLAPRISGPWFHARLLVPALPFGAALAAWGLRRFPAPAHCSVRRPSA